MQTSSASLPWRDSPSPVSRQNWTATPKKSMNVHDKGASSAGGSSKRLKQDMRPSAWMLRIAGLEELAGLCCLFSWVTQEEPLPQVLSSQENQAPCTMEVVYQMTSCTVPARSRKVIFNAFLKKQPAKTNQPIKRWSRRIQPIKLGNKAKIPQGVFF